MAQEGVLIVKYCAIFFVVGIVMGVVLGVDSFFEKVFQSKPATFVFDLAMMLEWSIIYYSALIAYNNGEIRGYTVVFSIAGIASYYYAVHKYLHKVSDKLADFMHSRVSTCEKTFKKLLHLYIKK